VCMVCVCVCVFFSFLFSFVYTYNIYIIYCSYRVVVVLIKRIFFLFNVYLKSVLILAQGNLVCSVHNA